MVQQEADQDKSYRAGEENMAEILDYFDHINIDVAKRKYYNINKVNSVLEELRALAADLVNENERQRQELMQLRSELGQKTANRMQSEELLTSMQSLYRETLNKAHSRADGIVQEAEAQCEKLEQDSRAQRENAEKQLRECLRVLQSREEENLRFLRGYLDKITDAYGHLAAETPELPTETLQTDERASAPFPEAVPVYPSAAGGESEEGEEKSSSGPSQLRDLELQIQRLAEEINALESGR